MCGIVGYVGEKQALEVVVAGLRRLEYRGYDSAGVAVISDGRLEIRKKAGKLTNLETLLGQDPLPQSTTGIGHTRWATHGGPTDHNAHPHVSADGRVAVIHNGIIENFAELREELLARGVPLASETDSEVVAHLLAEAMPGSDLRRPCRLCVTVSKAHSRWLRWIHKIRLPLSVLVAVRRSWWAWVKVRISSQAMLRPSSSTLGKHSSLARIRSWSCEPTRCRLLDFSGTPVDAKRFSVDWDASAAEKGGYELFMLKEIAEQPKAVADSLRGRINAQQPNPAR